MAAWRVAQGCLFWDMARRRARRRTRTPARRGHPILDPIFHINLLWKATHTAYSSVNATRKDARTRGRYAYCMPKPIEYGQTGLVLSWNKLIPDPCALGSGILWHGATPVHVYSVLHHWNGQMLLVAALHIYSL